MQPTNALINKEPVTIENVFKFRPIFIICCCRKIQPKAWSIFHKFLLEQASKRWARANIDSLFICLGWKEEKFLGPSVIPFVVRIQCFNFKMKRSKFCRIKPAGNFQSTLTVIVLSTKNSRFIMNCMMQKKMWISNKKCGYAQRVYLKI